VRHGRLPRADLRSGDALPGRHQIGGRWSTGSGVSLDWFSGTEEVVDPAARSVTMPEGNEVAIGADGADPARARGETRTP
jgi:hypothetical protein